MRLGKQRYDSKYMAIKYFYENNNWSINWMCRQLSVSRAAYYKWLHRDIPIQERMPSIPRRTAQLKSPTAQTMGDSK